MESSSSDDDGNPSITYSPGDEIVTVTRMRGIVHAVNDDGTYHLVYKSKKRCGATREDKSVRSKYFSLASGILYVYACLCTVPNIEYSPPG